ncbi:MAG: hypothetical protein ACE5EG_06630 [Thermoanaerobaculia bacterium]
MGGTLSRLIWRLARPLYALLDRAYRRWHRLERVGDIFHVGRETWRGAERRLEDGTALAPGDTVLRLHLDGALAAAESAGGESAAATGRRFARRFLPACRALARRLSDDPRWGDIVAVHTVSWVSPYVGEYWGFEAERLAGGLRNRVIRWHIGNLLAAAEGQDHRRGQPRPWPVALWISRRRLCERYLDEALER